MRILFLCLFTLGFLNSCANKNPTSSEINEMVFEENEEGEYDIIVLDSQYDYFLHAIAKPKNFHSESYYKARNSIFVTQWNARHSQPLHYDPNLYSINIDYNPQINYGYDFEYKLFNFFMFIEWKYDVNLDGRMNRY